MLHWFIRFPEFAEITEFPLHLGKTPMGPLIQQNFNEKNLLFDLLQHAKMFSDAIDFNKLSHLYTIIKMLHKNN